MSCVNALNGATSISTKPFQKLRLRVEIVSMP